jgi:hypothetical protein
MWVDVPLDEGLQRLHSCGLLLDATAAAYKERCDADGTRQLRLHANQHGRAVLQAG